MRRAAPQRGGFYSPRSGRSSAPVTAPSHSLVSCLRRVRVARHCAGPAWPSPARCPMRHSPSRPVWRRRGRLWGSIPAWCIRGCRVLFSIARRWAAPAQSFCWVERKTICVCCGISTHYRFNVAQMFLSCTMFQPTTKARNYRILYVICFFVSILHLY